MRIGFVCGAVMLAAAGASGQFIEDDVVVLHEFTGTGGNESYGWAVSELGDIDGDGVQEAMIAVREFSAFPYTKNGRVEVYSGATGALIYNIVGSEPGLFGYSVADAGDMDGDGVTDIVGGTLLTNNASGGVDAISGATGQLLWSVRTGAEAFALGAAVSGAGDVNGDGHADVMAGAPASRLVNVYSGVDGALLRTIHAPNGEVQFGFGTSLTDDLDGGGLGDFLISAPGSMTAFVFSAEDGSMIFELPAPNQPTAGAVGQFFVWGTEDTNGDGIGDLFVGDFGARGNSSINGQLNNAAGQNVLQRPQGSGYVYSGADGSLLHNLRGKGRTLGLGTGRVAGDADGDGLEDLLLGAWVATPGGFDAGQVLVFSGIDGAVIRTISADSPGGQFGFDAMNLGDTNGDGAPDYLVSAPNAAKAYIIAGLPETCAGDLNRNGSIEADDIARAVHFVGDEYSPADIDGDGDVDGDDIAEMRDRTGPCN